MVFISHKWEEKTAAKAIKKYLEDNLIDVWLDEENLQVSDALTETILKKVEECKFFVAQFSKLYLKSTWCMKELRYAESLGKKIIPIFEDPASEVRAMGDTLVNSIASSNLFAEVDVYNRVRTWEKVRAVVQIQLMEEVIYLDGRQAYHLKFDHYRLPDDFLTKWHFEAKKLLADSKTDSQPIKPDMVVAISGVKPGWLVAHLVIPFFNKRDVFVFNKPSDSFIGVYEQKQGAGVLGKVIPYQI